MLFELGPCGGQSAGELAGMCDPASGDPWLLAVLSIGIAPILAAKLRKLDDAALAVFLDAVAEASG